MFNNPEGQAIQMGGLPEGTTENLWQYKNK